MSKQLDPSKPVIDALRRHVENAHCKLLDAQAGSDQSVHDARKSLKQARALLRLLRGALSPDEFGDINARLRDAGGEVSEVRDAIALDEAFAHLTQRGHSSAKVVVETANRVQAALSARRAAKVNSLGADGNLRKRNLERLADICEWIEGFSGRAEEIDLKKDIRRQFKTTRRALRLAKRSSDTRSLHEWRKQVKYLYNAILDVMPANSKQADRFVKRAEMLSDFLGDEHDLAELNRWLNGLDDPGLRVDQRDQIRKVISVQREHLRLRAWRVSRRLFTGTPGRFARRVLE
jgi:CHAD domain-containing protein